MDLNENRSNDDHEINFEDIDNLISMANRTINQLTAPSESAESRERIRRVRQRDVTPPSSSPPTQNSPPALPPIVDDSISFFDVYSSPPRPGSSSRSSFAPSPENLRLIYGSENDLSPGSSSRPTYMPSPEDVRSIHSSGSNANANDSDDVIAIDDHPIIDLCSPSRYVNTRYRLMTSPPRTGRSLRDGRILHPRKRRPISRAMRASAYIPPELSPSPSAGVELVCAICMENPFNNVPYSTLCGHIFCKECINRSLNMAKRCPKCRRKITKKGDIHPLFG